MCAGALALLRTLPQLGFRNVAAVALHRARLRAGLIDALPSLAPRPLFLGGDFARHSGIADAALKEEAAEIALGRLRAFGGTPREAGVPPAWLRNLLSGVEWKTAAPWWRTHAPIAGDDIKGVWEASRFDWLLVLTRAARAYADPAPVHLANDWVQDWIVHNPPGYGPNWACGQETTIRLMQTLLAARLLGQETTPSLSAFVSTHVARVAQTCSYAAAQDNNHATSEAFGLFAGGAWLAIMAGGAEADRGAVWSRIGRHWLEIAVTRLMFEDGGFSQYSLNYHRVLLQTLSQAELWRRWLGLPTFSPRFYARAKAATRWLAALVSAQTGDAPNLGSNDGARPYRLDSLSYRDYRPSVQLAAALFLDATAYASGPWDEPLRWCGLEPAHLEAGLARKHSRWFDDFGLALLNPREDGSGAYAFVRVPRNRFRPPEADMLHFDLWDGEGRNLLADAGTFSYAEAEARRYYSGIAAHNTISFDGREPMPRLSRFLFGDWVQGEAEAPRQSCSMLEWWGTYRDVFGARHRRTVRACGNEWLVVDEVEGFVWEAVLHWRLGGESVSLAGMEAETERLWLRVEADVAPLSAGLVQAPVSLTYAERRDASALKVVFGHGVRQIRTYIRLK